MMMWTIVGPSGVVTPAKYACFMLGVQIHLHESIKGCVDGCGVCD